MTIPWFRLVGFGPCHIPKGPVFKSAAVAVCSLKVAAESDPSGWTGANARIYEYATRKAARAGDISDEIGKRGRVA